MPPAWQLVIYLLIFTYSSYNKFPPCNRYPVTTWVAPGPHKVCFDHLFNHQYVTVPLRQ
jgi:hypothetical protein